MSKLEIFFEFVPIQHQLRPYFAKTKKPITVSRPQKPAEQAGNCIGV